MSISKIHSLLRIYMQKQCASKTMLRPCHRILLLFINAVQKQTSCKYVHTYTHAHTGYFYSRFLHMLPQLLLTAVLKLVTQLTSAGVGRHGWSTGHLNLKRPKQQYPINPMAAIALEDPSLLSTLPLIHTYIHQEMEYIHITA